MIILKKHKTRVFFDQIVEMAVEDPIKQPTNEAGDPAKAQVNGKSENAKNEPVENGLEPKAEEEAETGNVKSSNFKSLEKK